MSSLAATMRRIMERRILYLGSFIGAVLIGALAAFLLSNIAGIVVLGIWAIGVAASLVGLKRRGVQLGRVLAGAGTIVGVASIIHGMAGEGGASPYRERIGLAILAGMLAAVAGAAPWLSRLPRWALSLLVFPVGLLGFMATLLWYINTAYTGALPFWLLSSVLLVAAPATPAAPSSPRDAVSSLRRDP